MNENAKQEAAETFFDSFGETEQPWLDREDRRFVDESDVADEEDMTVQEIDSQFEDYFYAMVGYRRG